MDNPALVLRQISLAALVGCGLTIPTPRPAAAAPDHTRGMALMGASVGGDGALGLSSGAIQSSRLGVGVYDVKFERDVTTCLATATSIIAAATAFFTSGTGDDVLRIVTVDSGGNPVDQAFSMIVFCPK